MGLKNLADLQKKFESDSVCSVQNKQLSIFDTEESEENRIESYYKKIISEINPDEMTPKDALEFLYKLKKQLVS